MAYKQKPPTFMGSCLKQYTASHGETGETKTFETKEEYKNFNNDDSGTGWTKQAKGLASVELSQDNYNRSKTQGNLNILNQNIANLSPDDKKKYEATKTEKPAPLKATAGYNMLMRGAGKGESHNYTSGSRSYRTEWGDSDDMYNKPKSPYDGDKEDGDPSTNETSGTDKTSSTNIDWPPMFKKSNDTKQDNYAKTSCTITDNQGNDFNRKRPKLSRQEKKRMSKTRKR